MPNCPEFGTLITASGFIEHTKTVARGKLKGLILQLEMPLSIWQFYKMGIYMF